MFEKKNALPGSELHFSIDNRNYFVRARQHHANMRGAVVGAFIVVFVVCVFGHKLFEKLFEISPRRRSGILHDDQTATRVAHEHRHGAGLDFALRDNLLDLIGDFIRSLAACRYFEIFCVGMYHLAQRPTYVP